MIPNHSFTTDAVPADKADLSDYARSVHAQFGEDGILEEIFRRLGVSEGYFVEFGAWDGRHLSNAHNLAKNGWRGLFIEGNTRKFGLLKRNAASDKVSVVNRMVAIDGPDTLDNILVEVGAPKEFDLLSIDIDSDDLAIFMSLRSARAKCVVIEFNPTIPFDTEYINERGRNIGNSALSIKRHAESIGYSLVAITETNLILLDSPLVAQAHLKVKELERSLDFLRYFFGYDGTLIRLDGRSGSDHPEVFAVPWQHYRIAQPIPSYLRGFDRGQAQTFLQIVVSLLVLAVTRPFALLRYTRQLWSRRPGDRQPARP
jgi:hypothetical protein